MKRSTEMNATFWVLAEPGDNSYAFGPDFQAAENATVVPGIDPSEFVYSNEPVEMEYVTVPPNEIAPRTGPIEDEAFIPEEDPQLTDEELFAYQVAQVAHLVDEMKNPTGES